MFAHRVGVALAVLALAGCSGPRHSTFVPEEALRAQGIELIPVPITEPGPRVDVTAALATARGVARGVGEPREAFRILARPTATARLRSAWLFLFEGGEPARPCGPARGGAQCTTGYTGVLIDDQTGALLFWFQGGSVSGP